VQKNESELSHLRLELRAIEARCLEYVPPETDQELLESIENWKRDWARLQRQMTERHMHHEGHSFHGDTTITSMDSVAH
jgi:acyl-coenzyme A thioesterase PaaI-like protein